MKKLEILIVDDEPINLAVLKKLLAPTYIVRACKSGKDALNALGVEPRPNLILLDIMMPGIDGYDTLAKMREELKICDIPVIYISSLDSSIDEEKGFNLGAVDYITKPFRPAIVLERVRVHLELKEAQDRLKKQNEWLEAEVNRRVLESHWIQDVTLSVITQLAETRDAETGNHILRTRAYVEILARRLKANSKYVKELNDIVLSNIIKAAPLHDIGKIGIPDSILLKPGKLTTEEFEIMKTHCKIGGNAIRTAINKALVINSKQINNSKPVSMIFLEEGENITTYHHEKWDGTGYPFGLKGVEIPLSARLMALADVFDALTTPRSYKRSWSMAEASEYIKQQKGKQFDPDVVESFEAELCSFENILRLMEDNK